MINTVLRITLLSITVSVTAGCAGMVDSVREEFSRDSRDAPWDPQSGSGSLLDQLPPWDHNSQRRCCGHLPTCEPYQTPRC